MYVNGKLPDHSQTGEWSMWSSVSGSTCTVQKVGANLLFLILVVMWIMEIEKTCHMQYMPPWLNIRLITLAVGLNFPDQFKHHLNKCFLSNKLILILLKKQNNLSCCSVPHTLCAVIQSHFVLLFQTVCNEEDRFRRKQENKNQTSCFERSQVNTNYHFCLLLWPLFLKHLILIYMC